MDVAAIATVGLAFFFAIGSAAVAVLIGYYQATSHVRTEIGHAVDAQIEHWRLFKKPLPPSRGG